jgi:hypothetical protein
MTWTLGPAWAAESPRFGWCRLRTPGDELTLAVAIPLGASLCIALVVAWILATPWMQFLVDSSRMLAALAIAIPAHALSRMAAYPRGPGRRWLRVVCSTSRLALDTGYDGPLSRTRLLFVLGAPFLVGSVLPIAICTALRIAPDFVVLCTLTNALTCGTDGLALLLVLAQIPGRGLARMEGDVVRWTTARSAPSVSERMPDYVSG